MINMLQISLYGIFRDRNLRSRENADIVISKLNKQKLDIVEINFKGIEFASMSFCNELTNNIKGKKNIKLVNLNSDVKKMMKFSQKKPKVSLKMGKLITL